MNALSICIDNPSRKSGPAACRVTFLHGSFYLALDRIRSAPPFRSLFLLPPGPHAHLLYMAAASLGGRGLPQGRSIAISPYHAARRGRV